MSLSGANSFLWYKHDIFCWLEQKESHKAQKISEEAKKHTYGKHIMKNRNISSKYMYPT